MITLDIGTSSERKILNDTTELEELGGGFASLVEMDNSGVRYAFNKKIDINQIEKIELKIL